MFVVQVVIVVNLDIGDNDNALIKRHLAKSIYQKSLDMARTTVLIFALLLVQVLGSYKFKETKNPLEQSEYPTEGNFTSLNTLVEFVKLVEENNLNVSLIASSTKNHEDNTLKEAMTMTMTFPVNQASVTTGTLTKESFEKLVKVGNADKLTVGGSIAVNNELTVVTNNRKGLPITKAYKIFTGIKNGKTGFVFDEENYVARYNFLVTGADGKNQTTRVFYGDVDVDVVDKSSTVQDSDLTLIKKSLVDAIFTYEEEIVPKATIAILGKVLPDHDFDVAAGVGDHSYIDSDYWVQLKILDDNYLVYTS